VKAYLEVVGFWTDEYLQKKLGKLRELDVENLLIAVIETSVVLSSRK